MSASVLTTSLTGSNNDLDFTATRDSVIFNTVGVEYVDPGAASQELKVTITNKISVSLATDSDSAISTLASDIITAIMGVKAAAVITGSASAAPANAATVKIGNTTYTFKTALSASGATPYEVLISTTGSTDAALGNLVKAINGTGTPGTDYGTGTEPHALVTAGAVTSHNVTLTAKHPGVNYNGIATVASDTNTAFAAATLGASGNTAGVNPTAVDASGNVTNRGWRYFTVTDHSGNDGSGAVTAMTLAFPTGSTHEPTTGYATVAAAKLEGWIFEGVETTGAAAIAAPQNLHLPTSDRPIYAAYLLGGSGRPARTVTGSAASLLIACELYAAQKARKGQLFDWGVPAYQDRDASTV